ncbi:MAG: hypothetical protein AAFN43_05895, partial [Pseudomonadota bacterium]
ILALLTVSACASGKIGQKPQGYQPARFMVEAVVVDTVAAQRPSRGFLAQMRRASDNTRKAYNAELGDPGTVYNLELSVEGLDVDQSVLSMTAILRNPEDGIAVRTVSVRHQLMAGTPPNGTIEQQLLRETLPKAFNGVYGMDQTPVTILPVLYSGEFFSDPTSKPKRAASAAPTQSAPAASVSVETQAEGEPKIITCAIC